MKYLNNLCLLVAVLATSFIAQAKSSQIVNKLQPLSDDFLVGFETGVFLRKSKDQMEEYNCPKANIKMEEFQKVRKMWPAVAQIITTMNEKDEELKNMMDSLNIFIDHVDELVGVFENDYAEHGAFCQGLRFAYNGSNLLFNIAETIVSHAVKNMQKGK